MHAQKVFEEFKLKNIGGYHDLYVQSDTLLLADVLLMAEKGIWGGICHAIHRYGKQIINIWKIIIKALNHHNSCI